ncbi:MAG: putative bifunctional diguanylate cyclase/phosphodiesterase [Alphaproteobacteria bacterium]
MAQNNEKIKKLSLLNSSPAQIWKSRISWRIALAVFLTILAVQAIILNFTLRDYEQARLNEVREIGRSAIVPLIETRITDLLAPPITDDNARKLITTTKVNGMAVYSSELNLIKTYGEPMALVMLDRNSLSKTYRSPDGSSYEVVFRSNDLQKPFIIVARLDSAQVQADVQQYVEQTILVMLLMSAFVTTVLMIALGHWLLEPILFMRNNLIAASKNPENPQIQDNPFDPGDEIGGAIELAQTLIKQNADNIARIKGAAQDKIHKLAYYDTLTGLPNRILFIQTLTERIREQTGSNEDLERFAVITIDLDHFKDINDSMGHNVGDAILRSVGKRLRAAMPEIATVSRTGEDEFAVTMPLSDDLKSSKELGEKIINVIRGEPFKVFNEQFQVRASVGVSTFPDDAKEPDQVLKNADIALNRAKEEGRDTLKEYSEDFDRAVQARFQMLRDLRDAMEQNQLELFYQPQLDLNTGKVIGAEALLRWWKPDNSKEGGTFISPGEFIPVAEQSGLIVPIGEWVMMTACKSAKEWIDRHGQDIRIAVNVSAAQFSQSDIVTFTQKVLQETGLEAHRLELEVTESVFMDDIQHTIQTLQNLHALGVELAIDDFGTGYSSLSYLRQFPIDRLKIDQSFIRNALNNPDDASIAKTIIGLGHSLNLKVIAEGVETIDHEKFLQEHKCDEVQGFRYSKPVPQEKFVEFITSYTGDLSSFSK